MTHPMKVTTVGWGYDADIDSEAALFERYSTLTGWSEALLAAGAAGVTVVHRFGRDARVVRNGVEYVFVRDGPAPQPAAWRLSSRLTRVLSTCRALRC